MMDLSSRVSDAVRYFWSKRDKQAKSQGKATGKRDAGDRTAVTGGGHMDGFADLVRDLFVESGISAPEIFRRKREVVLPGWFRPTKQWDLLVVSKGKLIAVLEFKSQIGSIGNNHNNRTEEVLGNASDIHAAYREGAFRDSLSPWLGYMMLIEDSEETRRPPLRKLPEPHFPVFDEFRTASYIQRYEVTMTKLLRERLYDAACLIASDRKKGPSGKYREPNTELSFQNFAASLMSRAIAHAKTGK